MGKRRDIIGVKFGHVTPIEAIGLDEHGNILYKCECDCGTEINYYSASLRPGRNSHCGCLNKTKKSIRTETTLDSDKDAPLRPVRRSRSIYCQPMLSDAFKLFKIMNQARI
jgi:hypothetical protein